MRLVIVVLLSIATLAACEGKLQKLSNHELSAKMDECNQTNPTAPGKVTACENLKKECARRRKEGNFAC